MSDSDDGVMESAAWLMVGATQSIPGWLQHDGTRLRLFTDSDQGFDVAVDQITDVTFPWYYFGGGCKLRVAGRPVRLSFVRPNGAAAAARPGEALRSAAAIAPGRAAGRACKARLTG